MAKLNDDWVVQPHGQLEELDDGLFTVAGEIKMPIGNFPRRMTIARLADGTTALWSPFPLDDPGMRRLEAIGAPAVLIVPGIAHRLDIRAYRSRYPQARIACAPRARGAVEEAVPVDLVGNALADPEVTLDTAPGVGELEAILWVRRAGRAALVLNDMLANVRHPHGLGAQIMARLFGFGVRHPQMPRIGRKMFVKDSAALGRAFRGWAEEPGLVRVIVSHGDVIVDRPSQVLHAIADDLDPRR